MNQLLNTEVKEESLELLKELIRIKTINPPGNELKLLEFVGKKLKDCDIKYKIFQPSSRRGNLVARIGSGGTGKPVMMAAHADVVGADISRWDTDPFEPVEKDDYLYGRGAIDDKGMLALELMVLFLLVRKKVTLHRDVILLITCDEERGGKQGMTWMVNNHFEEIDAEFAINEGGRIFFEKGKYLYAGVQNLEKLGINIVLKSRGPGGHSSVPVNDNPIVHLSKAIASIENYTFPVKLNPATKEFFEGLGILNSEDDKNNEEIQKQPLYSAMLRDTICPTVLKSGLGKNIIPYKGEVNLNCRLLPGTNLDEFVKKLEKIINNEHVEIFYNKNTVQESPLSSTDSEMFKIIKRVIKRECENTQVLPFLSTGATDSVKLRRKGILTYGLLPFPISSEDLSRMHKNNERINIDSFYKGLTIMWNIILNIAS